MPTGLDFTEVIVALIGALTAVLTAFVIPLIRGKLTDQQQQRLEGLIRVGVYAAEQLHADFSGFGQAKKEYVLHFLLEKGVITSVDKVSAMIDALIESIVYEINGGL